MRVLESNCRGFHLGKKCIGAPKDPHGAEPEGVRAWNCWSIAASVQRIEVASEVHKSGIRADALVIGVLVASLHATEL
jgi:hypothetical protein